MEILKGKKILLGVSGGIAAFKACELLRLLVKSEALVRVVMTRSATKFVTPLTFSSLGAELVTADMWDVGRDSLDHVKWAEWADMFVVAPATANIIAKMATGIADEVLSTQLLAFSGPILLAPAMNVNMWNNYATQRNIAELNRNGVHFVGPTRGHLANLTIAEGRMNEPQNILGRICGILANRSDLTGVRILVTAGPTIEPLDPVRFISNRSSGKMGYAIARAARERGADVTLISGPVSISTPPEVKLIEIETAFQMKKAVSDSFKSVDAVIMAAAVADFKPKTYVRQKIKKGEKGLSLALVKNPDILEELASKKGKKIMVGFALETENLETFARKKMREKKLDMIIANDPTRKGAEFGSDFNKVIIFRKSKKALDLPLMPKKELAHKILDELVLLLKRRR